MAFAFVSAFVVLVFWRPQEWLFVWLYGLPMLDVVVLLALFGCLVELDQGKLRIPKQSPQLYLLGGVWFAGIMSHVAHTYFVGMMNTIPLMFKSSLFAALLLTTLDRVSRLRRLVFLMVAMTSLMAVHALLQEYRGYGFAWQQPIYVPAHDGNPAHTRSYFFGIFEDPNDLAQILAVSIPLCFLVTRRMGFFGILAACGLAELHIRGILSTHSRGGQLGMMATLGVMFLFIFPKKWLPWLISICTLGGLMLCPLASTHIDESAHDRIMLWGQANQAFKHTPLFGVGINMISEFTEQSRAVHNAYVLCYAETGVFGYWFWFNLLLLGFLGAWRTYVELRGQAEPEARWLGRAGALGIASLAGYAVSAYFLGRAFVYPMYFLVATLAAIPVIARGFLGRNHPPLIRVRRDLYVLGTIASLFSIAYIYISIILLNRTAYIGS